MTKTIEELAIKSGIEPITSNPYCDELTHYHNVFNKDLLAICEAYHEQALLSQGEPVYFGLLTDKSGWESITEKQYINHNKNDTYLSVNKYYIAPPSTEALLKAIALCNAFHSELPKVDSVDKGIFEPTIWGQHAVDTLNSIKPLEEKPSIESLQQENELLKDQLQKVTSTLEIKSKDLAWWQNQFQSKSGAETKDIADSFIELIAYAKKLNIALENICWNRCNAENNPCEARDALAIPKPKCME